ncbi:LacI family transcriptional regulator [Sphingomonas populi]|uniref:LacI family transcriptional regulator n=2 Tax=Sphingomonas populi TaxID=2484750 RepID=A0A4V2DD17_9SPHN|nr:LacI family transcriptional regulator [Sphingomonas populi]
MSEGRSSRRSSQAITMGMVAERAGVSPMTVSNIINNRKRVLESTRAAVMKAIDELGYVPNFAAQALASAASIRVGFLYHNIENAFLSALLVGALSGTTRKGAQLLIRPYETLDLDIIRNELKALIRSGANGILLGAPVCEMLDELGRDAFDVPLMAMAPGAEVVGVPSVMIDNVAAAREMTDHLLAMGHRRIAFIRASPEHLVRASRYEGYSDALAAAGIVIDPTLVVDGTMTFESGLAAAAILLNRTDRPSAIFASTDDMAAAVVSVAHRMGFRVPEDLSVVGFDDSPIAIKIWPTLTTVRQSGSAIAERATIELIERLRAPSIRSLDPIYLPHQLVHRGSVAAPSAARSRRIAPVR